MTFLRWRKLYAQHLDSLAVTLDNYTMSVLEGVMFDEDRAPDEIKREILSAAVDSYFPDIYVSRSLLRCEHFDRFTHLLGRAILYSDQLTWSPKY